MPANTVSCATCPNGYYCTGGTFQQAATDQGKTACPAADDSTRRTTFSDQLFPYDSVTGTYDRSGGITISVFRNQSWEYGWTNITECRAYYLFTTAAVSNYAQTDNVKYNLATGKYDTDSNIYYTSIKSGYYLDIQYSSTYCNAPSNIMHYRRAVICPPGYYCPGGNVPSCGSGTYGTEWGRTVCPAGHYCPAGAAAPTPCPAGTYSNVTGASDASVCKACTGLTYSDAPGATECTPCPTATALKDRVTTYWYWSRDGVHDHLDGCRATIKEQDSRGDYHLSCAFCDGDYGVSSSCEHGICLASSPTKCIGGYYWSDKANTDKQIWAPSVEEMKASACVPVGAGYWSPDGSLEATACPAGTTTIGYGPGADEAADCGVSLHIGDATVHLRSEKRTAHALHVRVGNQTFYGDMTTAAKGKIRTKIDDTVYSVYDDSM